MKLVFSIACLAVAVSACTAKVSSSTPDGIVVPGPGSQSSPVAKPSPTGAVAANMAKDYSTAKYAFCSNQGIAVLVDLTDLNLAANSTGKAQVAYRACNSGSPFTYEAALRSAVVQRTANGVSIAFGGGEIGDPSMGDWINSQSSQTGLDGASPANSEFGGNSGLCFLLADENGTGGLPFGDFFSCQ